MEKEGEKRDKNEIDKNHLLNYPKSKEVTNQYPVQKLESLTTFLPRHMIPVSAKDWKHR